MKRYVIIKIKVHCPRSGSHRKVQQNDNLCPVQDCGSLAVVKVTARDQDHYKGPLGAFVTYCNISCFFSGFGFFVRIHILESSKFFRNYSVMILLLGSADCNNNYMLYT